MKKFGKGIIAVLAFAFGVYEFYDDWFTEADYGESITVSATEIYYTDIDTSLVNKLADYLVEAEFIDGEEKSVRLQKLEDGYSFGGVYDESIWNDSSYLDSGQEFAKELSLYVFDSDPITFQLCDDQFNVQNEVVFDIEDYPYGWELNYGQTQLFFTSSVHHLEAEQLGEYLVNHGYTEYSSSIQLDKSDSAYHFNQVTVEDYWYDEQYLEEARTSAIELSDSVFNRHRVIYAICDDELNMKSWRASE